AGTGPRGPASAGCRCGPRRRARACRPGAAPSHGAWSRLRAARAFGRKKREDFPWIIRAGSRLSDLSYSPIGGCLQGPESFYDRSCARTATARLRGNDMKSRTWWLGVVAAVAWLAVPAWANDDDSDDATESAEF